MNHNDDTMNGTMLAERLWRLMRTIRDEKLDAGDTAEQLECEDLIARHMNLQVRDAVLCSALDPHLDLAPVTAIITRDPQAAHSVMDVLKKAFRDPQDDQGGAYARRMAMIAARAAGHASGRDAKALCLTITAMILWLHGQTVAALETADTALGLNPDATLALIITNAIARGVVPASRRN